MDIQSFVTNHGTFAVVLLIIIVVYIGYTLYWIYAKKSKSPSSKSHGCLNKQTQEKIADEIQRKLKEIDSCDCKDACKLKSPRTETPSRGPRLEAPSLVTPGTSRGPRLEASSLVTPGTKRGPDKRHLPLASESASTTSSESSESIKTESFGNDDFY